MNVSTTRELRSALASLPHSGLTRLAHGFPGFDGVAWMKRMSSEELTAHRLAHRAVPDGVPPILAAWPVEGRPRTWAVIMADGGVDGTAVDPAEETLVGGMAVLAGIHAAWTGDPALADLPDALERSDPGPPRQGLGRMDLFRRRCEEWGLGLSPTELSTWAAVIDRLPQSRIALSDDADRTLVHGDLHTANLVVDRGGRTRIIDWGCAARQCAAWDLALLGSGSIESYREARGGSATFDESRFTAQLRAASIIRLLMAVDRLLASSAVIGPTHRAVAVRRCVARAREVADR